MSRGIFSLSVAASFLLADSFTLGQVQVQDSSKTDINMFESSIKSEDLAKHSDDTITTALDNITGVSQDFSGARAESTISIRGFDARRVGVFIDGVPVYIPYDGNFDYGRFLTSDIGEIDVSKGYSSVVYGSNTMGGVINIISKKPTKELQGNIKAKIVFDSDASMAKHMESLNVGTMQNGFYAQLGGVYDKRDHFRLSDDYKGSASQPKGDRLRSKTKDYKINLKAGYEADDKSEIAISYINQKGQKQQPPSVDNGISQVRYWDWPHWDKETISLMGQKNFDSSYIKALAYYDKSKNSLYSYDDATYTSMNKPKAFKTRYDDYGYGARFEYGLEAYDNFVKVALNYKKDVHRGYEIDKATSVEFLDERYEDHTISIGIEDTYAITKELELLAGLSYERRKADEIFDTNTAYLDMLNLVSNDALTPQGALVYTLEDGSKLRASIAQKTYLPSMKERYSRKMGTSVPNVKLKNEKATHYELGYKTLKNGVDFGVNIFYSDIKDAIQAQPFTATLKQNQNIGKVRHIGAELELAYKLDGLEVGANYTYINAKNKTDSSIKITNVPKHQAFAYAKKALFCGVSLYANAKYRDGGYDGFADDPIKNQTFSTFDAKLIYEATKELSAEVGVKNLGDKLYGYDRAFPVAGREFFASLEYKF